MLGTFLNLGAIFTQKILIVFWRHWIRKMPWIYRPDHPKANANGLVDRSLVGYETSDAPYVISDTMDPTRHMCDSKYYTSKAKFREVTKAHNCIEYGNEAATLLKPRTPVPLDRAKRRDDIKRAIWE